VADNVGVRGLGNSLGQGKKGTMTAGKKTRKGRGHTNRCSEKGEGAPTNRRKKRNLITIDQGKKIVSAILRKEKNGEDEKSKKLQPKKKERQEKKTREDDREV